MTIRKTLLKAFLFIGLTPTLLLVALAFFTIQVAMQAEINQNLLGQAQGIATEANKLMFERLQNAATWSTLEVMQDMQVQDIDKRISIFLTKLQSGYGGIYSELHTTNRNGRIISSSNPALIGRQSSTQQAWQSYKLSDVALTIDYPININGNIVMAIHAPIYSQFKGDYLGELVLEFDWNKLNTLLDLESGNSRLIALVDNQSRLLAASKVLREKSSISKIAKVDWQLQERKSGVFFHSGAPLITSDVIIGLGRDNSLYAPTNIQLAALVIQSKSAALAPVYQMAVISCGILAILLLLIFIVASKVSAAIARPIVALTLFTKEYKFGEVKPLPPSNSDEINELGFAFSQMVKDIDRAKQDLVRASKLAVVGEMSSVIIHEVRTPLGIMRSSAQMLKRESQLSNEGLELIGFIESETERLNRLISSMLDSARPRLPNKTLVDMHALIQRSTLLLSAQLNKKHIDLIIQCNALTPYVLCDAEQMTQVLLNLILNASQILPLKGSIYISTYHQQDSFFIDIADNGPGIPIDERAHIFEAFFCRREGGVGLGLAIVEQIVSAHGGEITVSESQFGGACFTIRLEQKLTLG